MPFMNFQSRNICPVRNSSFKIAFTGAGTALFRPYNGREILSINHDLTTVAPLLTTIISLLSLK